MAIEFRNTMKSMDITAANPIFVPMDFQIIQPWISSGLFFFSTQFPVFSGKEEIKQKLKKNLVEKWKMKEIGQKDYK